MNGAEEALAHKIADARNKSHEGATSNTPFTGKEVETDATKAHHRAFVGVWGEMHFARAFGLSYTLETATKQYAGDGGIDFKISVGGVVLTIDIKTSENALHLMVKEHDIERCADLLVLAQYTRKLVTFLGWETAGMMATMPVGEITPGYPHYFRAASELRSMSQLVNIMARRDSRRAAA